MDGIKKNQTKVNKTNLKAVNSMIFIEFSNKWKISLKPLLWVRKNGPKIGSKNTRVNGVLDDEFFQVLLSFHFS